MSISGFLKICIQIWKKSKKVGKWVRRMWGKWNTKEHRDTAREILDELIDYFDDYDDQLISNRTSQWAIDRDSQTVMSLEELNSGLINSVKQSNLDNVKEYINKGADINAEDDYGKTVLHIAAKRGLLDIAKFLIDKGADVDIQENMFGQTPLHLAAAKGHTDLVKYLIEKGANVDAHQGGWSYSTALHLAAENDHLDIVKYLIEKGANPKVTDSGGKTPLQRATQKDIIEYLKEKVQLVAETSQITEREQITTESHQVTTESQPVTTEVAQTQWVTEDYSETSLHEVVERGNLNAVKYFVEEGDSIEEKIQGRTPLHLAAENGHIDIVKYLIAEGADLNIKYYTPKALFYSDNPDGRTPLHLAAEKGYLDVVKYLIDKGADMSIKYYSATALTLSAQNGHFDVLKYLIDRGADFTSPDEYEKTILFYAAESGNWDMVKYLIEKGASINIGGRKRSILPHAAESGNLELVEYLVEKGANINDKDVHGYTSLHRAVFKGKLDIVKYLVGKGAYINDEGGYSKTSPLYDASMAGHLDIAKYLIENGANLNRGGDAALRLAVKKGDLDLVKYLVGKDLGINTWMGGTTLLQTAIEEEKFDIAIFLIDEGADITVENRNGWTILHQAAEKGGLDLIRHLVEEKGMDVNIKSRYNNETSLHLAVKCGSLDLVKYLVEKGAHINVHYYIGTPLHTAVSKGNLEIVKYLVHAGADLNMEDGKKHTPLHVASKSGNLDIVKYLLENGADPNAMDIDGKSPLDFAAEDCRLDIVEQLIEKQVSAEGQHVTKDNSNAFSNPASEQDNTGYSTEADEPRVTCEHNNTTLHSAAKYGELEIVKCLIEEGVDVNAVGKSGLTPLHEAVINRPLYGGLGFEIVKYLVENGADINAESRIGERSFLDDGVGIGSKRKIGRTPLHYAAIHGQTSFSVVNGRVTGGCLHGNLDVVKYLVNRGADLTARDEDDKTPLDLARSRCNPEVVEFLLYRCRGGRSRRDLASNSLMNNNIVNWVKHFLPSSTRPPTLLTSRGHDNTSAISVPEINTTLVNNTLISGILAISMFNKEQYKQQTRESPLSLKDQLMRNIDDSNRLLEESLRKAEEEGWGRPSSDVD